MKFFIFCNNSQKIEVVSIVSPYNGRKEGHKKEFELLLSDQTLSFLRL